MITPGFFSFFNTHRALMTAQNALNVVNHNISNANTAGYSRQRAEISAFAPYPMPSIYGMTNGQMGQGAIMTSIERIRDSFIDGQFRLESSLLGYNQISRDVLQQVEAIMAEPTTGGINAAMQRFFESANELSLHPESIPVRQDFIQAANDVMVVVQQQARQLKDLRTNLVGDPNAVGSFAVSQANIVATQINEKLNGIAILNREILTVFSSGARPNDLLDKRDLLLDELSQLVDIEVIHRENGLIDLYIGEDVTTPTNTGVLMVRGVDQLRSLEYVQRMLPGGTPDYNVPGTLRTVNLRTGLSEPLNNLNNDSGVEVTSGKIAAILEMGRGGPGSGPVTVRNVFSQIDRLFDEFVARVNEIQVTGLMLGGASAVGRHVYTPLAPPVATEDPLQVLSYAMTTWMNNPNNIAAAQGPPFEGPGDNRNALRWVDLQNQNQAAINNTTFSNFFNSVLSQLGIESRTFQDRHEGQNNVIQALDLQRSSISGVNVDEEMIDMLRFQRSFEASSKMMSVLDEIMQTIINMT
jgi:flagellar hook-associated protein 1